MRGAQPDVECPRCGATAPPSGERLVTCARCALVFPPHEIQKKLRRAELPEPPESVAVSRTDGVYEISWPFAIRWSSMLLLPLAIAAGIAAVKLWSVELLGTGLTGAALVAAYGWLAVMVSRQVVVVDATSIRVSQRPLRFVPPQRFERAQVRGVILRVRTSRRAVIVLELADQRRRYLLWTSRVEAARYLADLLGALIG